MELRAERGRALVSGAPDRFEPPAALRGALHEWAEVAAAVCGDGEPDPDAAALVSARGRQLAARLATAAGTAVGYTDPVDGMMRRVDRDGVDRVDAGRDGDEHRDEHAHEHRDGHGHEHRDGHGHGSVRDGHGHGPVRDGHGAGRAAEARALAGRASDASGRDRRARRPQAAEPAPPAEPTPWATGLTVSAFVATITLAAVVTLVRGLSEMGWLLGVLGLVVVTAGLGPSVWMSRHTPLWRWVSYGVAAGLAVSWLSAALASLGS